MKPNWTMRQLLALLRGMTLMVALFWGLVLLQLGPTLVRRGLAGVREHIERVAMAGVPPDHWNIAISRMYEALGATFLFGCALFVAQRYLARKLNSYRPGARSGMTYSNSSPS
jgi:hypothetical protein